MYRTALAAVSLALAALPSAPLFATTHDFDGDGRGDIVWRDAATGQNAIWRSGDRATQLAIQVSPDPRWRIAGSGDFDGNGRADLLWRHATNGGNVIWLGGNANGLRAVLRVNDPQWRVAGVGDFDSDGRSDIVWRNLADGRMSLWPGANSAQARALPTIRLTWTVAGVGDLDGDGRDDLVWRHLQSGANAAWRSADPALPLTITGVNNQRWKIAAVDDFDGDGRADLLWREAHDGRNVIWPSANPTAMRLLPTVDWNWYVASTGDYDSDGRADVHWRDPGSGRNVLWAAADPAQSLELAAAGGAWGVVPYEGERVLPLVNVQMPTVVEGSVDSTASAWLVMSHESVQPVDWSVAHDNSWFPGAPLFATFGEDLDFAGPSTGKISAGDIRAEIPLIIRGDTAAEANEIIYALPLTTFNAVSLWYGNLTPGGLIRNDDANTLWLSGTFAWEGNSGPHPVTVYVWLSRPQATPVTLTLETFQPSNFGGTPNVDYVARSVVGAVIPAGATHLAFDVTVIGDLDPEDGEGFGVRATAVTGVQAVGSEAFVYIGGDDPLN